MVWGDKRGAMWIWAVCLLTIVTMSFLWFAVGWPTTMVISKVESQYTFPSEVTVAISFIKTLLAWFLILMLLGLLLWVSVNSQRKGDDYVT